MFTESNEPDKEAELNYRPSQQVKAVTVNLCDVEVGSHNYVQYSFY